MFELSSAKGTSSNPWGFTVAIVWIPWMPAASRAFTNIAQTPAVSFLLQQPTTRAAPRSPPTNVVAAHRCSLPRAG